MPTSVFDRNLTYLHNSAKHLLLRCIKEHPTFRSTCFASKDAQWTVKYKDRYLHSRYQPKKEAHNKLHEQLQHQDIRQKNYIFFLGADLLYQIDVLTQLDLPREPKLFLIYPEIEVLLSCFLTRDLACLKIFKQDVYVISPPYNTVRSLSLNLEDLTGSLFIDNLKAYNQHSFLVSSYELLRSMITRWFSDNLTQFFFEKKWLLNALDNIFYLPNVYSFGALASALRVEKKIDACLLIAAGPSLYASMEMIRNYKQAGVVLMASDTALSPLLLAGVVPDFVISVDGGYYNSHDFNILPPSDCSLIAEISVYPSIIRNFLGKIFLFALDSSHNEREQHTNPSITGDHSDHKRGSSGKLFLSALKLDEQFQSSLYPTGSVANLMLNIADQMGFKKMGLVGWDFSYPFAESHCESTTHKLYYHARSHRLNPVSTEEYYYLHHRLQKQVESYHGDDNYTENFFLQCKADVEDEIERLTHQDPSLSVENNTPYGLKMQGVHYPFAKISFAKISKHLAILKQKSSTESSLATAIATSGKENFPIVSREKLLSTMNALNENLLTLQSLSHQILASIEKKEIDTIKKIEDALQKKLQKNSYLEKSIYFLSLAQRRYTFPNEYLKKYAFYKEQHKWFSILLRKNSKHLASLKS